MSINKASIYFVPGFDPVGPSRYAAYFANSLRKVYSPQSIRIQACPSEGGSSSKRSEWRLFTLSLNKESRSSNVDLFIADYTSVIKDHWDYGYLANLLISFRFLIESLRKDVLLLLNKDHRLYWFRLYVLCLIQLSWLIPILLVIVVGSMLASTGSSSIAAVVLLLGIWVFFSWLCYSVLTDFNLVWLLKGLLFKKKLSRPNDTTLEVAALNLATQLDAFQSRNLPNKVYLVSHCSGISLLLLILSNLRERYPNLLSNTCVITFGRNLPLPLDNKHLRSTIFSLLEDSTISWTDVTSRDDFLCDALISPPDYIGAESVAPRNLSILDSTPPSQTKHQIVLLRLISLVFNQFSIHMKYLTSSEVRPNAKGSQFYSLTELLYILLA